MKPWEWFFYGCLAAGFILFMGGCSTVKTIYDTCREGLCR